MCKAGLNLSVVVWFCRVICASMMFWGARRVWETSGDLAKDRCKSKMPVFYGMQNFEDFRRTETLQNIGKTQVFHNKRSVEIRLVDKIGDLLTSKRPESSRSLQTCMFRDSCVNNSGFCLCLKTFFSQRMYVLTVLLGNGGCEGLSQNRC